MNECYQGYWNAHVMADDFWSIQKNSLISISARNIKNKVFFYLKTLNIGFKHLVFYCKTVHVSIRDDIEISMYNHRIKIVIKNESSTYQVTMPNIQHYICYLRLNTYFR